MRIAEAILPSRDLGATEAFFRDVLGLPVGREADSIRVRVGPSLLVFHPQRYRGSQHLAFTIPTGSFDAARAWLGDRAVLLAEDGVVEFEGPPSWDSRSLCFDGPDEQVLELIERRRLPGGTGRQVGSDLLLCVSEVGLAVPGVPGAVQQLAAAGAPTFGGEPAPEFAAVGDEDGLLILSAIGRAWKPTDRAAQLSPVSVSMHGVAPVRLSAVQQVVAPSS